MGGKLLKSEQEEKKHKVYRKPNICQLLLYNHKNLAPKKKTWLYLSLEFPFGTPLDLLH